MARTTVQTPPVTTSVTALDVTRWEYEAGGRLKIECQTTTAATSCTTTGADRRTAYTYDGLGRTASTTLYSGASAGSNRGGWTTTYDPNGDGQVASIAYSGTAMVRSTRPPARRSTRARTRWPSLTSRRGAGGLDHPWCHRPDRLCVQRGRDGQQPDRSRSRQRYGVHDELHV